MGQEVADIVAVPVGEERIGHGEGNGGACRARHIGGFHHRLTRVFAVPEIAFEEQVIGPLNHVVINVVFVQLGRGTEIGVHGALGIRGHQNDRDTGIVAVAGRCDRGDDAECFHVLAVEPARLVIADATDKSGAAAKRRDPGHGIGDRTAGRHGGRRDALIELTRAGLVDQSHRALVHAMFSQEAVLDFGNNINDGITDADHFRLGAGHRGYS